MLALQKRLGTHIYEDEFKKATGRASERSKCPSTGTLSIRRDVIASRHASQR